MPCAKSVPHLNELNEQFADKGLSIIGVTGEGRSATEKWVEEKGTTYAYAYDKGGKLARELGVSGIPAAFLIDPTGTVVWSGHPGNLDAGTIEKSLEGSLARPLWEWPDSAKGVKKALEKRKWAKALDEAADLGEDGVEIAASLQKLIGMRAARLAALHEAGDYLPALELAEALVKEFKDLEEGDKASEILSFIKKDSQAKKIVKAQEDLRELDPWAVEKSRDAKKVKHVLENIIEDLPGTVPAAQARVMLDALLDRFASLR